MQDRGLHAHVETLDAVVVEDHDALRLPKRFIDRLGGRRRRVGKGAIIAGEPAERPAAAAPVDRRIALPFRAPVLSELAVHDAVVRQFLVELEIARRLGLQRELAKAEIGHAILQGQVESGELAGPEIDIIVDETRDLTDHGALGRVRRLCRVIGIERRDIGGRRRQTRDAAITCIIGGARTQIDLIDRCTRRERGLRREIEQQFVGGQDLGIAERGDRIALMKAPIVDREGQPANPWHLHRDTQAEVLGPLGIELVIALTERPPRCTVVGRRTGDVDAIGVGGIVHAQQRRGVGLGKIGRTEGFIVGGAELDPWRRRPEDGIFGRRARSMDRKAFMPDRRAQFELMKQREAVFFGHQRQRDFGIGRLHILPGVDIRIGTHGDEVIVVIAQIREIRAGAGRIQPGIGRLPCVIFFPARLGSRRDLNGTAAKGELPQLARDLSVPDDDLRFAIAVVGIVHRVRDRRGIDVGLVHHDLVVHHLEGDGERVVGGRVGAIERPAQQRLAVDILFALVTVGAGDEHGAFPRPAVADAAARAGHCAIEA